MFVASIFAFYILNYVMVPYLLLNMENYQVAFPPPHINPYTFVVLGAIWSLGLYVTRWQFNNMPKSDKNSHSSFELKTYLANLGKNQKGKTAPQTLGEIARKNQGSMEQPDQNQPPASATCPMTKKPRNNGSDMGSVVEGVLAQSLADAEMTMTLELPTDTTLNIFGQEVKVKKGQIKVKPMKSPDQKISDLFRTSRKRSA